MEGLGLMGKGSRKTSCRNKDLSLALRDGWEFKRRHWGKERKGPVWSLACWVLLQRSLRVPLGNFELSRERDMSHRKYTDGPEIDLKTQLCDFTERERPYQALNEDNESDRYN